MGRRVVAWEARLIELLREVPSIELRIVEVAGKTPRDRGAFAVWALGTALASVARTGNATRDTFGGADVVIDLCGGGPFAEAAEDVWRLRLGTSDDRELPFARECAEGALTFEVALYRQRGDVYELLRRGRFGVRGSYAATARLALNEIACWPAIFVAALLRGELRCEPYADAPRSQALRGIAKRLFIFFIPFRQVLALLRSLVVVDQWNVGFAAGGAQALLNGKPLVMQWLPDPAPRTFLADPFLVERDGIRALFVEEYDYTRDRGVIEAITLDAENRTVRRQRVLEAPTHLSYPYPLLIDGELYLVPENAAAGEVALYRCVRFPDQWERDTVSLAQFDGVDTTIFAHSGRWWAFCTRYSRGSNVGLHALHAPSARGPWTSHPLNPIVVDIGSARPAGAPFIVDGQLYRPGQDCSRTYGGAVAIARVDELTPTTYRETAVARVEPPKGPYGNGLHTVSLHGDAIVLDGKRTYRDLRYISRLLRTPYVRAVGRRLRRVARMIFAYAVIVGCCYCSSPSDAGSADSVATPAPTSSSLKTVWETGSGRLGQYVFPAVEDGQCARVGPTISGHNASFTVLRNKKATYTYHGRTFSGASTCWRNQINPIDATTGIQFLLHMGRPYVWTFETVVTFHGNYRYQGSPNGGIAADIPAIVWQTHSYGGDGQPCDLLVIQNTYVAYTNGIGKYGVVEQGGRPTWNFHTCAETDFTGSAYNSNDTLHDGQVDGWQIEMTPALLGKDGGSIVVYRNGSKVYQTRGPACDASTPDCWWNFGPYMFYFKGTEAPSGWNDAGITVEINNMTLMEKNPG